MDIFIDGACSGNPGPGKAVVYIDKNQCNFISHDVALTRKLERTTNNKAEYYGLILALEWIENAIEDIKNNGAKQINIYTDSKLIEGQINRGWRVNKNTAIVLKAKRKIKSVKREININIKWLPREKNEAGIMIENGMI